MKCTPPCHLARTALAAGTSIAALAPVNQALGRYLVDLRTPPHGTVCPSGHVPFDPGSGQ
jgi:hypothetical protein